MGTNTTKGLDNIAYINSPPKNSGKHELIRKVGMANQR